jgi:hypothetical protein
LRLETNSVERARALRDRVQSACPGLVRHRSQERVDPRQGRTAAKGTAPPRPHAPEQLELLLEYKRLHYAEWLDLSVPALGGDTPRAAVRTAKGRAAVDVLLQDMENHEQRLPRAERFDFSELRKKLKLD